MAQQLNGAPRDGSSERRIVAEISDYSEMLEAMRTRARERQIAIGGGVNDVACLPDGYLLKLLAPRPIRRLGMLSMGPVLQVLGVKLLMVEDADAMAFADKHVPRCDRSYVRTGVLHVKLSRRFLKKIGRLGGKVSRAKMSPQQARQLARHGGMARAKALSPEQRRAIARNAVRARWSRRPSRRTLPAGSAMPALEAERVAEE